MKVLIVHAHPESQSFCAALKDQAIEFFQANGDEVKVSDLYAMAFDPVGGKHDFLELNDDRFFKYQMEQVNAYQNDFFEATIRAEMEKLEWCDVLIFNFPLWWFGLPAILKGWVDRVFAMGFVYGAGKGVYENGSMSNKTAFITMTTGGPEQAYGDTGKNGDLETILFPIQHGMFYFAGMTVLPPFVSFSPARAEEKVRTKELERYSAFLSSFQSIQPIYTNHGKL